MAYLTFRAKRSSPLVIVAMLGGVVFLCIDFYATNKAEINSLLGSRSPSVWANIVEGLLWLTIGVGFGCYGGYLTMRRQQWQVQPLLTSISLIVLGFTDLVEAYTGSWWKPWPLLFWKVVCLLAVLVLCALYIKNLFYRSNSRTK